MSGILVSGRRAWGVIVGCGAVALLSVVARADWVVDYPLEPQPVFGGGERKVEIHVNNREDREVTRVIRYKLVDGDSADKTVLMEGAWKNLRMLPYQKLIESVTLQLPDVQKPVYRILTLWDQFGGGTLWLHVYPTNLLRSRVSELVGDGRVGMLDGELLCLPVFERGGVACTNLEHMGQSSGLGAYQGKLVIVTGEPGSDDISKLPGMAARGVGVVWVQSNFRHWTQTTKPSYYVVPQGQCAVVVVQRPVVAEVAKNPWHQLRLLECCRLAVKPEAMQMPDAKKR